MKNLTILFLLFLAFQSNAQVPQGINYQAVIRNSNGTTVNNTSVGLQLRIIQGSAAGTPIYAESHNVMTSNIGLINVVLGQGTVIAGVFNTINWATGPYFIEVASDINGGSNYTIMGTQQMMSVPYALYAENSGNPGPQGAPGPQGNQGLSAYQVWLSLGNVGTEQDFLNSLVGPQGPQGTAAGGGPVFIAPLNVYNLASAYTSTNSNVPINFDVLLGQHVNAVILYYEHLGNVGQNTNSVLCKVDVITNGQTYEFCDHFNDMYQGTSYTVYGGSSGQITIPLSQDGIATFVNVLSRTDLKVKLVGYYP